MDTLIQILLWIPLVLIGLLAYGIHNYYMHRFAERLVTWMFEHGMRLKRANDAGELGWIGKAWAAFYIGVMFLPADFALQFVTASHRLRVKPRFELTTTLISRWLGDKNVVKREFPRDQKQFVIAMRKFLKDQCRSVEEGYRACGALGYFDLIDRHDPKHFRNSQDYR